MRLEVLVFYKQGKVTPLAFWINNRKYQVEKVNLVYSQRRGLAKIYYFAVSTKTAAYKLAYNSETLSWRLLEVYADDSSC